MNDIDRSENSALRAIYQAPKLTIYGDVKSLTAAGTIGIPENNPGQGSVNQHN